MSKFDPYYFYFELPIYAPVLIEEDGDGFTNLLEFKGNINGYNPYIKENTTFNVWPCQNMSVKSFVSYGGINYSTLVCLRTETTFYYYYYYDLHNRAIQKIGQYPSLADIHISKIKQYDKVLPKLELTEFSKAIGLAAHGVGIGSFVYLRRIFEKLIEEAAALASASAAFDLEKFTAARMNDKIEMLRDYLPTFLVENRLLYGILSKGVHALSDAECLMYFETVKVGIELILDEKVTRHEKEQKLALAKAKLNELSTKL